MSQNLPGHSSVRVSDTKKTVDFDFLCNEHMIRKSHLKLFDYAESAEEIMSLIEAWYAARDQTVLGSLRSRSPLRPDCTGSAYPASRNTPYPILDAARGRRGGRPIRSPSPPSFDWCILVSGPSAVLPLRPL